MNITFRKDTAARVLVLGSLYAATAGIYYLAATRDFHYIAGFEVVRKVMLVLMLPLLAKYAVQLGCAPFYSFFRKQADKQSAGAPLPSVSVLIPAWNEEVGIVKTIQSVLDTNYPSLQVVVINDGSTDGTHEEITRFMQGNERLLREGTSLAYLKLENGGKARAMNSGLMQATGEIVVTVDADSAMHPDAITKLVRCFDDPEVGGVAGNVVVANRRKPIEWMQQMEYLYGFFFKRADSLFNSVYIIGGAAAAYRREVLQQVGGFDHSIITEDIEMSTRILSRGFKTRYAADAVIYTEGPSEWRGLCNQRLRWKYGRLLTFLKYRRLFFSARHNPYLSFLLLPTALYAEILLLAETVLLATFILYTFCTSDYMPLAFVTAFLTAVVATQIALDPLRRFHRNLYWLAPVAWLVFYAIDLIELQALVRSIRRLVLRRELQWQKWIRVGVLADPRLSPAAE